MQKVKTFAFGVLFGIAAIGLTPSPARAAVLLVDGGGQLTGATGVDVLGTFYDVTFVEGSCIALFSGCDELSDFAFNDSTTAEAAAQALLDQVFIDVGGAFDTSPELTLGCTGEVSCVSYIPYGIAPDVLNVLIALSTNFSDQLLDFTNSSLIGFGIDTTFFVGSNYAVFTPTVIPLPPAVLLFGSGLVALFGYARIGRRRRRQV